LLFSIALSEISNSVQLTYFHNCPDVLEFLATTTTPPDIIILDLNIPGNDGHKCLIKLKAGERTRSIPVVVWSSSATNAVKEDALNLGALEYIIKPASVDTLKNTIAGILKF
jgi:CheY-like chemotaxis protein